MIANHRETYRDVHHRFIFLPVFGDEIKEEFVAMLLALDLQLYLLFGDETIEKRIEMPTYSQGMMKLSTLRFFWFILTYPN